MRPTGPTREARFAALVGSGSRKPDPGVAIPAFCDRPGCRRGRLHALLHIAAPNTAQRNACFPFGPGGAATMCGSVGGTLHAAFRPSCGFAPCDVRECGAYGTRTDVDPAQNRAHVSERLQYASAVAD
jgi:hypothetical protein